METNIAQNLGVDICKATFDVYLHPAGIARQFTNDAKDLKALLGWLRDRHITRVVFEPTGRYHHAFERRLGRGGLSLAKVNPRQARRFAEAIDAELKASLSREPDLAARFNVLVSIPGIGETTAIAMLIEMPELGTLESKQVAPLAELAPRP